MPAFAAVDDCMRVRGILGKNSFLAEAASGGIEMTFIAVGKSALFSAVGTVRRRRNQFLFPVEDGGDFVIENQIIIRDFEQR